jgi:hypothetical protein
MVQRVHEEGEDDHVPPHLAGSLRPQVISNRRPISHAITLWVPLGQARITGLGGLGPYFFGGPFEKCLLPEANFLTVYTAKGDSFHVFLPS